MKEFDDFKPETNECGPVKQPAGDWLPIPFGPDTGGFKEQKDFKSLNI